MFPISAVLPEPPGIKVIDVGAMSLGEDKDPYAKLLHAVPCEVIGFEPVARECERLNRGARPGCRYLPYAIGDGSQQMFYECNFPMTSSLLEPDEALLGMFHELLDVTRVVDRRPVQTVRLDDIPETRGADYLKLDVQGGELMVLQGAGERLRELLVVHTEIEFLPMYKRQPLFGDIDAFMRGRSFVLHKLSGLNSATFKLPGVEVELSTTVNQAMWGEAVYVRDFRAFDRLGADALLKIAVILHENYGSTDLAAVALAAYDRKAGGALTDHYLELLFAGSGSQ
ncbi:MAG: FkbM family methyltransferase [Pseudomonadota bacterium]